MKKLLSSIIALSFLATACTREQAVDSPERQEVDLTEISEPGSSYIRFDEDTAAEIELETSGGGLPTKALGLDNRFRGIGIVSVERVFPYAGEFEARTREAGLHRWYRVVYDKDLPHTKAASTLKEMKGVTAVRPVLKMQLRSIPFNDTFKDRMWNLDNSGGSVPWASINVVKVWEQCTTGSPDVVVAVVDSGVSLDHEDLAGNTIPGSYNGSWCFVPGHTGTYIHGESHGTHVAGTIAAVNNNGKGVCGIAGGDRAAGQDGVKIMSCQVFFDEGEQTYQGGFETAIKWAADHGAVICNNSWGVDYSNYDTDEKYRIAKELHDFYSKPNTGDYADPIKSAVDYFNTYAGFDAEGNQTGPMAGGIVVFAAGNDALPYGDYCAYPGIVSVGATTTNGKRASYSNYGSWVDIAAPGGSGSTTSTLILSCLPPSTENGQTYMYGAMGGTSMAAPHVSGVAALIASYHGGPGFTREMLLYRLLKGANSTDFSPSENIGPLVDAYRSVYPTVGGHQTPPANYSATATSNSIAFSFAVHEDELGNRPDSYRVFASRDRNALTTLDPAAPAEQVHYADIETGQTETGAELGVSIYGLEFESEYHVAVAACDFFGDYTELSVIKSLRSGVNNPPVIDFPGDGKFSIQPHESIRVNFTVTDSDPGHKVSVEYKRGSENNDRVTSTSNGNYILTIDGNGLAEGVYHSTVTAKDNYGATADFDITFTIEANSKPVIIKPFEDLLLTKKDVFSFDSEEFIYDPDGETLSYNISMSESGIASISQAYSELTVTPLTDYGFTSVHLSASDAGGEMVEGSFRIAIRPENVNVSVYPNPVSSVLKIGTGRNLSSANIRILSATGGLVFEDTVSCSVFEPATIDLGGKAPGKYTVEVKYDGATYRQVIVKI